MKSILFVFITMMASFGFAQSPIGIWKTIDDKTGNEKSHIEIFERDGKLYGKVIKLLKDASTSICSKCPGEYKDKPIVGIEVLKNLTKDGASWSGGTILDPNNGKEYSAYISLKSENKLKVRGYIGFSLLGRTQFWYRLEH